MVMLASLTDDWRFAGLTELHNFESPNVKYLRIDDFRLVFTPKPNSFVKTRQRFSIVEK